MYMVTIMADMVGANGDVVRTIVGDEYGSWISPQAAYAFERLVGSISPKQGSRNATGVEHNHEVLVYRAEQLIWGEGDLAVFDEDAFIESVETLAGRCILDESWPLDPAKLVDGDDCAALKNALNAAMASWARSRNILSGVWKEVGEPVLRLPAHLDAHGEIALSDEDRARLDILS